MKRRGADENSSIIRFIGGVYKSLAISRELMARVRDESRKVVYKGIVKEIVI